MHYGRSQMTYEQARQRMEDARKHRDNVFEAEKLVYSAMQQAVENGVELKQIEEALRNSIQLVQEPPQVDNRKMTIGQYTGGLGDGTIYGPGGRWDPDNISSTTKI